MRLESDMAWQSAAVSGCKMQEATLVAYNFKQQFVTPILVGTKRQTIRAPRKRHARRGETIQLYTAQRTKYCRAIGTATCQIVCAVMLDFTTDNRVMTGGTVFQSGHNLDEFARMDGFADWSELREFWSREHPGATHFNGVLIRWTDFKEPAPNALALARGQTLP